MPFSPHASPAPGPPASASAAAEQGLAPWWETTVFLAGREWAGLLALLWVSGEVGLPLAPRSCPAPSSRMSKARATATLKKESEQQEWAQVERTSTPVTLYLKQKKIRHLVPGELCSPRERRKGLGLDDFFPISETQDVGGDPTVHPD